MNTRKITVHVFSYPSDFCKTFSIKRLSETQERLEYTDNFLSDKTLEQLLVTYTGKVAVYASYIDEIRCYRIVLKDNERRIFKIHKA